MAPGVTWSSGDSGLVTWGWQRLPWGAKIPFRFSQWAEWRLVLCEPAEPGSRACSLHSRTGPHSEGPTLDLMLCCYRLEFLHAFWTGNPTLSFCSGPCKLYGHSWSHDMKWLGSNELHCGPNALSYIHIKGVTGLCNQHSAYITKLSLSLNLYYFFFKAMTAMAAIGLS